MTNSAWLLSTALQKSKLIIWSCSLLPLTISFILTILSEIIRQGDKNKLKKKDIWQGQDFGFPERSYHKRKSKRSGKFQLISSHYGFGYREKSHSTIAHINDTYYHYTVNLRKCLPHVFQPGSNFHCVTLWVLNDSQPRGFISPGFNKTLL